MQLMEDCSLASQVPRLEKLFARLGLISWDECQAELIRLREEISSRLTSEDVKAVDKLRTLARFVRVAGRCLHGSRDVLHDDEEQAAAVMNSRLPPHIREEREPQQVEAGKDYILPDEFRCPISERESIQAWLLSGKSTCPKSGQRLIHLSLIPNYSLRSLISQWCEAHNLIVEPLSSESTKVVDRIESSRESLEVAKSTAAFLVGKLATGSFEVQKQVAYELRLLAKSGMENRICIAEAGAIPFLLPLLASGDAKAQENAVTALLNLSIYDNNKRLIVAAGGLEPVLQVLDSGRSMEARQNSAATIFSLASIDEYRVLIGSKPSAIPSLLRLLRSGTTAQAKKDAATALLNLLRFVGNRVRAVRAGAVPTLVTMLTSPPYHGSDHGSYHGSSDELVEDALAVLALLAECGEGLEGIIAAGGVIPLLVQLLWSAPPGKGKENALSVLLALCRNGGDGVRICIAGSSEAVASLQELLASGTPRARRKARSLLKVLGVPEGALLP